MKQFAHHFNPGLTESVGAGSTQMCSLGGTSIELDQLAVRNTRPFHQAGTLSLLTATIPTNTLSGTATWKTALGTTGGTDGNMSVTFSAAQTGTLDDDSNTDDVAVDDLYSLIFTSAAGTGSASNEKAGFVWEPDSGSISLLGCNAASSLGVAANGTTYICACGSRAGGNTTEARTTNIITSAGTWRYLGVGGAAITVTTIDVTFTSRINGADGNQVVAFTAADDEVFLEDTSNTDTVASGDRINWEVVTTNSTNDGGTNFEWVASQINHTSDETLLLMGGNRESVAGGATVYFPVAGQTNSSATESVAQHAIRIAATSSHLGLRSSQNSGTIIGTLRINGVDGNQVVTVVGSPSQDIDDSNTDDLAAGDILSLDATSTGSQLQIQSSSLRLTEVPGGATLTADPTSYTLTGAAAGTLWDHVISAATDSYTLTGIAATLSQTWELDAATVAFTLSGLPVTTSTSGENTGFVLAGTGVNNASAGTAAWTNPGNITADDGSNATVSMTAPAKSNYLVGSNFGLTVPSEATITGIEFQVQASVATASVQIGDVRSVKGGAIGFNNEAGLENLDGTPTNYAFGGAGNLWSDTWTPADVNASNFGVAFSVDCIASAGVTSADAIWAKIYYTDAGLETLNADPASYALTGTTLTFRRTLITTLDPAAYVLTGTAVTFPIGIVMPAETGAYVLTGQTVATGNSVIMSAESVSFALSGGAINTLVSYVMPADTGDFTLTGIDVEFDASAIVAESGAFVLTGSDVTFGGAFWVAVNTGGQEVWT